MTLALRRSPPLTCDDGSGCGCTGGHGWCAFCMQDMLAAIVGDLLNNDPDLQAIIHGPRLGVVDGSAARSGEVGEWISGTQTVQIPSLALNAVSAGPITPLVLPPGDWMAFADCRFEQFYPNVAFALAVPGMSNDMAGGLWAGGAPEARMAIGIPGHARLAQPLLLAFAYRVQAGGATPPGFFTMNAQAYRLR